MHSDQPPLDQAELMRKNEMGAGTQFGILLGLFGGGLIVSQILVSVLVISGVGLANLDLNNLTNSNDPAVVSALKLGQFLAAVITFLVPAIVFTLIVKEPLFKFLAMNRAPSGLSVLMIPILVIAAAPAIALTAAWNSSIPLPDALLKMEKDAEQLTEAFLRSEGIPDLLINMGVVAVTAAITEEVFFRGCMQPLLSRWLKNAHLAIWLTAFLFSLLHFQFLGFIPRMLLGALMGYLFYWTGSLWAPILAHFVNNGTGVLANYLVQRGQLSNSIETYGSTAGDWPGVIASITIMSVILYLIWKRSRSLVSHHT